MEIGKILYPHVSVDCVLLGFSENKFKVLLTHIDDREIEKTRKLPGSLIYKNEDLDEAAQRILTESTGVKKVALKQFKCFGSPKRTENEKDVKWLEKTTDVKADRIITVAYLSLCKLNTRLLALEKNQTVSWCSIDELPNLPFDHEQIVVEAIREVRNWVDQDNSIVFEFLPAKFTALDLRRVYEAIYNKVYDVRNFKKKMKSLEYIVPLDEKQQNVAHRAAQYFRFDRVKYNKLHSSLNY